MYKRILIPTDGSDLASAAARAGVEFAKEQRAEVFTIFIAPPYANPIYVEMLPPTEAEYKDLLRRTGQQFINEVQEAATAAGLPSFGFIEFSDSPALEIVRIAEENHCDLIFMGSHGRSGLGKLFLGSVTSRVLATCDIPVLVYRAKRIA
ncbi:MAG: universal stress protein [Burkholderia sp.]|nr:universal stress protein [Burkholderia sp.]